MIANGFFLPIYYDYVHQSRLSQLQEELAGAVNAIKSENLFKKNPKWEAHTHRLSDPSFRTNVIEKYSLELFKKELEFHVTQYMKEIQLPEERQSSFDIKGCWITQTMPGEYAHPHTHGHSDLSGVYYIKTNTRDGNIYFNSPLSLLSHSFCFEHIPSQAQYTPEVGKIIMFPGWLEHGVKSNDSDEERISISFNITFKRD
jgi:uncharacterized protein (TIGR02466 family)